MSKKYKPYFNQQNKEEKTENIDTSTSDIEDIDQEDEVTEEVTVDEVTSEAVVESSAESTEEKETKLEDSSSTEAAQNTVTTQNSQTAKTTPTQSSTDQPKTQKELIAMYNIELELNNYAEAMDKSKAITPDEGGKWQYSLFKVIKSVFSAKTQEEFNAQFNTILQFFHKNKDGIFNERFIFRFPGNWPGSQSEYVQNRRLLYMIIQTANPKNRRAALSQINMEMATEGMTEAQKQMLFNFYQV